MAGLSLKTVLTLASGRGSGNAAPLRRAIGVQGTSNNAIVGYEIARRSANQTKIDQTFSGFWGIDAGS
jgi:hypothetical protein